MCYRDVQDTCIAANMLLCVIMFPTQSDMAIPTENVWQMPARATRVIFSYIAHVEVGYRVLLGP